MIYYGWSGLDIMDRPIWRAARELYLKDCVVEALAETERVGGFDCNDIAAEAAVREKGKTWDVRDWLTVEAIPAEAGDRLPQVLEVIGTECESLSKLFGWDNREAIVVTFLPREYEAPWMPGRWGYFVDKVPYDKICLPHNLLDEPTEMRRTVRHEFMHSITLNLSNGHAPRWLAEGMSTLVEGRVSPQGWDRLAHSPDAWLDPAKLVGALTGDFRDPSKLGAVALAYDQASLLGLFLYLDGGADRTGALLRAAGDESLLLNVELEVLGRTRVDGALRRVYHVSEEELFDRALAWVHNSRIPSPAF